MTVESAKTDAEPSWRVELRYRDVLAEAVTGHHAEPSPRIKAALRRPGTSVAPA